MPLHEGKLRVDDFVDTDIGLVLAFDILEDHDGTVSTATAKIGSVQHNLRAIQRT